MVNERRELGSEFEVRAGGGYIVVGGKVWAGGGVTKGGGFDWRWTYLSFFETVWFLELFFILDSATARCKLTLEKRSFSKLFRNFSFASPLVVDRELVLARRLLVVRATYSLHSLYVQFVLGPAIIGEQNGCSGALARCVGTWEAISRLRGARYDEHEARGVRWARTAGAVTVAWWGVIVQGEFVRYVYATSVVDSDVRAVTRPVPSPRLGTPFLRCVPLSYLNLVLICSVCKAK
ncbi:hypothetical protein DFP72DRAFT_852012 [Ephemerocybe angulata]|uniref:Uncharacterized protein n=1 Tax=Ephemerocybe angulata TaxID=980116 RepID=A0A8H6HN12_9AGAR|nr:hypothetical protein DFP72DRAFT_852012 [Tulosesus angulatus]